tara:strand:- start:1078 stop:1248 length:171 start_codon:yes stop_codon:yes gene_type:complete
MNTLAVLFGVLGVIGYFFYFIVARSKNNDGQGVNPPMKQEILSPQPSAADQKGMWD